jgi:hypothetical protein
MIIKGGSRAAPTQLGKHLLRADTNERVEILQLLSPTGNLTEALRDWQVLAGGTNGSKGLYHANIDPDARYKMTPEQWQRSVDVLEEKLGLQGQPRVIVLHEKEGREHIHVVWQRTDVETMTLRSDSQNYRRHEEASLALEQEFGHEHVPGKHVKRDRGKQPEMPKSEITQAEAQQAERSGINPRELKDTITGLYRQSDNAGALRTALEDHGLLIAKGDRRDYVIVDETGEVHSLARQIRDVNAKDLRQFMATIDPQTLPSVEQAKALQRDAAQRRPDAPAPAQDQPPPAPSEEERARLETSLKARHEGEARKLRDRQETERDNTAAVIDRDVAEKIQAFKAVQQAERDRYQRENRKERSGIAGWFAAVKDFFMPGRAAEEARQRQEAAETFERRLEQERADHTQRLNTDKYNDLAELAERHAQQRREQDARYNEDLARYLREAEAARRLLAEIEEQRRQQQLEQQRTRDGPDRAR